MLGDGLARRGIQLVYGGGRVGLMGIAADAALAAGGRVVGIIPEHIQAAEIEHTGLSELHVVDSMHTRKRLMVDRSDAFVVLPGGLGTLDETFEILTWKQLRLHDKRRGSPSRPTARCSRSSMTWTMCSPRWPMNRSLR